MKQTMKTIFAIILIVFAGINTNSIAQNTSENNTENTFILIVGGENGDVEEKQSKDRSIIKLREFSINNAKIKPECLSVLVSGNSFAYRNCKVSTSENLEKALTGFSVSIQPTDRFVFYYVGQANTVGGKLRLNLPGNDITHEQLAGWINKIKASKMLVVLDCPGAGTAIKSLTNNGRIIICGARSDQPYSTRFSEYFIPAMADSQADTDSDGGISILEAFTLASKQLDDLYRQQDLLKTESPILEDNGDGIPTQQPWRYKQDENDGSSAASFFWED